MVALDRGRRVDDPMVLRRTPQKLYSLQCSFNCRDQTERDYQVVIDDALVSPIHPFAYLYPAAPFIQSSHLPSRHPSIHSQMCPLVSTHTSGHLAAFLLICGVRTNDAFLRSRALTSQVVMRHSIESDTERRRGETISSAICQAG